VKTYRGIREASCHVLVLRSSDGVAASSANGAPYELAVPAELLTKPAAPFDWGTGAETAGAHYLAIALLADLLGSTDRTLIKSLLPPLRRFLSRLPQDGFEISDTVFHALLFAVAGGPRGESHSPAAQPGTQTSDARAGVEAKPPPLPGSDGTGARGDRHAV
jgi:hypothetical protein